MAIPSNLWEACRKVNAKHPTDGKAAKVEWRRVLFKMLLECPSEIRPLVEYAADRMVDEDRHRICEAAKHRCDRADDVMPSFRRKPGPQVPVGSDLVNQIHGQFFRTIFDTYYIGDGLCLGDLRGEDADRWIDANQTQANGKLEKVHLIRWLKSEKGLTGSKTVREVATADEIERKLKQIRSRLRNKKTAAV